MFLPGYQVCVPKKMESEFTYGDRILPKYGMQGYNSAKANALLRRQGKEQMGIGQLAWNSIMDWFEESNELLEGILSKGMAHALKLFHGDLGWVDALIRTIFLAVGGINLVASLGLLPGLFGIASGIVLGGVIEEAFYAFQTLCKRFASFDATISDGIIAVLFIVCMSFCVPLLAQMAILQGVAAFFLNGVPISISVGVSLQTVALSGILGVVGQ